MANKLTCSWCNNDGTHKHIFDDDGALLCAGDRSRRTELISAIPRSGWMVETRNNFESESVHHYFKRRRHARSFLKSARKLRATRITQHKGFTSWLGLILKDPVEVA